MSLKYIDKNGSVTVLAGLTPGGNLETGAVATREGTVTNPTVISKNGGESTAVVTFADAMPDANYEISCTSWEGSSAVIIHVDTTTISANGFSLKFRNTSVSGDIPANVITIHWKAYKLYEVANAEALYSTVQDLEAMVPSNASSTNKFSTADDLRTETRTLDRRLDDVEDAIPTSASITNKLVTQKDLSNIEIDKVEDINDVELTDIENGQTLIWDDTNSKWINGQGGKVYTAGDGINISNTDEISAKVDDTSITIDTNDALKVADTYKTIFVGMKAQWDALSAIDKIKYQEAHITDDVIGGEVADEVTDGLMSPVTSNAVFDKLAELIKIGSGTGNTANYIQIGDILICYGYVTPTIDCTNSVSTDLSKLYQGVNTTTIPAFAKAFAERPKISIIPMVEAGNDGWLTGVTANANGIIRVKVTSGTYDNNKHWNFDYIAIGRAAT